MLEFNSRNIISGYIKQLLSSIYLPSCKLFNSEKELKEYITSPTQTTSILPSYNEDLVVIIRNYKPNEDWFVKVKQDLSTTPFMRYRYNHFYLNLSKEIKVDNDLYDSYTHRYLGEYLRFIRDYFDLNLMSMYNCFDNTIEIKDNKKYFIIPIKYGKEYSLFSSKNAITYYIDTNYSEGNLKLDNPQNKSKNTSAACIYFEDIHPEPVKIEDTGKPLQENKFTNVFRENNLRLIIETDITDDFPIVVLEGNYSNYKSYFSNVQFNYEKDDTTGKYLYENDWIDKSGESHCGYSTIFKANINDSNFQLINQLKLSTDNYPISDRLIEYLFGNVITHLDPISKNIVDAKKKFAYRYQRNEEGQMITPLNSINGKFTIMDRFKMLEAINKNISYKSNKEDLLGYVDKDVEAVLDDERYPLEVK